MRGSFVVLAVAIVLAAAAVFACTPRARMCAAAVECGGTATCVAGRCQPLDGGTPAIAEVNDAGWVVRRLVLAPVDVAWLRRGDGRRVPGSGGAMPAIFTLGREADGDAILYARFSVPLPKDAKIVEAYLLLQRSDAVDADPSPISLHAARVVSPWDSRSVSWASQPAVEEVRLPSTRVDPSGRALVRLDVRALVERWSLHDRRDQGIAVLAESATPTGISFAFLPSGATPSATPPPPAPTGLGALGFGSAERANVPLANDNGGAAGTGSPRLELYVK